MHHASDVTTTDETPVDAAAAGGGAPLTWRLHFVASPDPKRAGTIVPLDDGAIVLGRQGVDLLVDDPLLSRSHLELIPDADGVTLVDQHSRNGTFLAGQSVERARATHGAVLRFGRTVVVLEADGGAAKDHAEPVPDVPGRSERARQIRLDLAVAASLGHHLLLLGETGTGKEHAAADFHRRTRRHGPLVRFNVAAVPVELFEAELFGHVAGAFTGASAARDGRVREARHGTLLLDEIGELALPLQAKLLRVLEEQRVRPVGGSRDVAVDVRFVASTNADLATLAARERFRPDLLARLCNAEVRLPRLQDRRADLLDLADAVQPALVDGRAVPWRTLLLPAAIEALLLAEWPHNLRTLRGVLARARTSAGREPIGLAHLPVELQACHARRVQGAPTAPSGTRPAASELRAALKKHEGSIDLTARHFGVHRKQVYRWLDPAGIGLLEVEAMRQARRGQP